MTCPIEPIPRPLMAAFVAAHHCSVLRLRMCAAVLLNRRADTHEVPNAAGQETRRAKG